MFSAMYSWWNALEFQHPWLGLLALLALPVLWLASRQPGHVEFSSLRLLPARDYSLRAKLAWLPAAGLALAVIALAISVSGPRTQSGEARIRREGIGIAMVVDISGSMQALDMSEGDRMKSRLDAVKEVFRDFVTGGHGLRGRPDDAIGLISFAGFADTRCPLTLSHAGLLAITGDLEIVTERAEDGTAIGDGLGLALERLREAKATSRIAILLTDGVNNTGYSSPGEAADLAASLGIKVYTIGVGGTGWAPFPVRSPFTGEIVLDRQYVELDEATLTAIADRTGGRYFHARDADALRAVYAEIDALERTDISEVRLRDVREHFQWPLGLALALAALAWLLSGTVFRRQPC